MRIWARANAWYSYPRLRYRSAPPCSTVALNGACSSRGGNQWAVHAPNDQLPLDHTQAHDSNRGDKRPNEVTYAKENTLPMVISGPVPSQSSATRRGEMEFTSARCHETEEAWSTRISQLLAPGRSAAGKSVSPGLSAVQCSRLHGRPLRARKARCVASLTHSSHFLFSGRRLCGPKITRHSAAGRRNEQ